MPDKAKPDDPAQSQRFIDMAKKLSPDEENHAFEDVFLVVAKQTAHGKGIKDEKDKL